MYGARGQQSQNTIWLGRYGHGVNIASSVLTRCPILNFAFDLMHASARMSSGTIKSQSIFFPLSLSFFHFFLFFLGCLLDFFGEEERVTSLIPSVTFGLLNLPGNSTVTIKKCTQRPVRAVFSC